MLADAQIVMTTFAQALKKLPKGVGEGLDKGMIVAWHVAVGDSVQADQILVEVETDKAIVDLRRIKLPLPDKPSKDDVRIQMELAELLRKNIEGCDDMLPMAKQAKASGKVLLGKMEIGKLGVPLRGIIRDLKLGIASRPVRTPSGISIFMVCNKSLPKTELPTAQQIKARLKRERLSVLVRRYMRDLRRAAVVDIRLY